MQTQLHPVYEGVLQPRFSDSEWGKHVRLFVDVLSDEALFAAMQQQLPTTAPSTYRVCVFRCGDIVGDADAVTKFGLMAHAKERGLVLPDPWLPLLGAGALQLSGVTGPIFIPVHWYDRSGGELTPYLAPSPHKNHLALGVSGDEWFDAETQWLFVA